MTQLVELQAALPQFEAAGVKLYAVSYDDPKALADFAKQHNITFPLLSDRDSAVIRRFDILNHTIAESDVLYYGIPFPGTYVIGEDGVIAEKLFNRHFVSRASAESMIDSALGELLLGEDEPSARAGTDEIAISATYHGGGGTVKLGAIRQLVVRFELAPGLHIYDEPVPDGMVATTIDITGPPGLHVEAVEKPPTSPLALPGLDFELQVWDGCVDFVVPVWVDDGVANLITGHRLPSIDLEVVIRYQSCDDNTCHLPSRAQLTVSIPVESLHGPDYSVLGLQAGGTVTSSMNTKVHVARLFIRGIKRSPIKGFARLLADTPGLLRSPARKWRRSSSDR